MGKYQEVILPGGEVVEVRADDDTTWEQILLALNRRIQPNEEQKMAKEE